MCIHPGPWSKSDKQAQPVEEKYDQVNLPLACFHGKLVRWRSFCMWL